jgi:hypothetical protein
LAWGSNQYGQLGDGDDTGGNTNRRTTPVQVLDVGGSGFLSNVVSVAAWMGSFAVKDDGTVWAWGYNYYGNLGNGTTSYPTPSPVPTQVLGEGGVGVLSNGVAISASQPITLALKDDGTVWAWGYNSDGQLGDGTMTSRFTPVQVGATTVCTVTFGAGEGGSGDPMPQQTVKEPFRLLPNANVPVPLNPCTYTPRVRYAFAGWTNAVSGGALIPDGADISAWTGNVALTASWDWLGDNEAWVNVTEVNVRGGVDAVLTLDHEPVEDLFDKPATAYTVFYTPDLTNAFPNAWNSYEEHVHTTELGVLRDLQHKAKLNGMARDYDRMFFRVKAVR